jgi:hypothetical protein
MPENPFNIQYQGKTAFLLMKVTNDSHQKKYPEFDKWEKREEDSLPGNISAG